MRFFLIVSIFIGWVQGLLAQSEVLFKASHQIKRYAVKEGISKSDCFEPEKDAIKLIKHGLYGLCPNLK